MNDFKIFNEFRTSDFKTFTGRLMTLNQFLIRKEQCLIRLYFGACHFRCTIFMKTAPKSFFHSKLPLKSRVVTVDGVMLVTIAIDVVDSVDRTSIFQKLRSRHYLGRCLIQYLESSSWLRLVNGTLFPRYTTQKMGWVKLNLNHRIDDHKCDRRIVGFHQNIGFQSEIEIINDSFSVTKRKIRRTVVVMLCCKHSRKPRASCSLYTNICVHSLCSLERTFQF